MLSRPFGQRRVEHVLLSDAPEQIRQRRLRYVVVGGLNLSENNTTLAAWQGRTGAELVATTTATILVSQGPQPWYVVRFPE